MATGAVRLSVEQAAGALVTAAVDSADALLREAGFCQPPTMYLLVDDLPASPVAGYVRCRDYYRGRDAFDAIARLGALAASMVADRIVVSWEHLDLCTALELPGTEIEPCGQVVVDATFDEHWVHWHPLTPVRGPNNTDGMPTVIPKWGTPQTVHNAPLPPPIMELLRVYRWDALEHDFSATLDAMEADGYYARFTVQQ